MRMTRKEMEQLGNAASRGKRGGRPIDPEGLLAISRKYGINRSTLRNRLRAGKTLDEAIEGPIKSRLECGELAAKARWGGTK